MDSKKYSTLKERFLRYVKFNTRSDEASETIFDDGKKNGTGGILKLCDKLTMKIDEYLGN